MSLDLQRLTFRASLTNNLEENLAPPPHGPEGRTPGHPNN
jgi:hypothetical protein